MNNLVSLDPTFKKSNFYRSLIPIATQLTKYGDMLALNLGKAMSSRLVTFDIGTHDATYIEKMAKRSGCELQGIKSNKATVYCKTGIDALNLIQNLEIKNFQSCLDDKIA